MCMTNRIAVNGDDPLAALIVRVIEDLKQRTAAGLAGGAMLEGDGWRLAAMQLSVARGRIVETLPFAEIDKVAVFDGKICLWRRGQDEPAAKISPDSKNASVLASLLSEWIEHQREASRRPARGNSRRIGHGPPAVRTTQERRFLAGLRPCRHWRRWSGAVLLFDRDAMPVGVLLLVAAAGVAAAGHGLRTLPLPLLRIGADPPPRSQRVPPAI